jgi:hypothetical protein
MVWVSNYSAVTIVVSLTNNTGGSSADFTIYPKQNETWGKNHWGRSGDETIHIQWATKKTSSFKVGKDALVLVYNDAVGTSTADFKEVS